jgi:hypothetical protein
LLPLHGILLLFLKKYVKKNVIYSVAIAPAARYFPHVFYVSFFQKRGSINVFVFSTWSPLPLLH